ncbi:hypothetical protein PFISCL1PPCAC_17752, partial [Pristionchus fissidentatus]
HNPSATALCGIMATDNTKKTWKNIECTGEESPLLPYICRRNGIRGTSSSTEDPSNYPPADTEITPPGYPHPNKCWDYTLTAEPDHLVELTIDFVEANKDYDYLTLSERDSGHYPIENGNLTGAIDGPIVFTTTESNIIRVHWNQEGAVNVRGFRMRYKSIGKPTDPPAN